MNRFIQKLFITILFLFFAFLSHAQDATTLLLEGTIGKARIMMELTLNGSDIWGQYYYKKHKKNH